MKFNPDMIYQSVPKQVFAIKFTEDNFELVNAFIKAQGIGGSVL